MKAGELCVARLRAPEKASGLSILYRRTSDIYDTWIEIPLVFHLALPWDRLLAQSFSGSSLLAQIESYGRTFALSDGAGNGMLKITVTNTASEERWTLHGRLVKPWVSELRASWKKEHETAQGRRCIVNLNEVTFIDKSGERMLRSMSNEGAQFVTSDLYIKHVVDRLRCKSK